MRWWDFVVFRLRFLSSYLYDNLFFKPQWLKTALNGSRFIVNSLSVPSHKILNSWERTNNTTPAPHLGTFSTSVLVFRLDLRFSLNYPQIFCCHFLISRSVLLLGKGLVCNELHFQDGVKTCEMERERKIALGFFCRHKYKKNKQTCEQLQAENLVFCSFCLWVFWRQLTTIETHTMTFSPRGSTWVPLEHPDIYFQGT